MPAALPNLALVALAVLVIVALMVAGYVATRRR
jgi:hypothetical protein